MLRVLLDEEGISTATALEIAARAGTHESTVIRLAQKLGYRGYTDLRSDARRDEVASETRSTVMRAESGWDLASLARDESRALDRLGDFISQAALGAAAEAIHSASAVYLFSKIDDRATRDVLARRLRRLGKRVIVVGHSAKEVAEHFASFDSSSVLIGFALRQRSSRLSALIAETRRLGGVSIIIADVGANSLDPRPDHLLAAPRGGDEEYGTQLVPMTICYGLQLAVFHLDPDKYQVSRDYIDDVTRIFGGTEEIASAP